MIRIQDYLISPHIIRYCCILHDGGVYKVAISIAASGDKDKSEAIVFTAATREIAEDILDSVHAQMEEIWPE